MTAIVSYLLPVFILVTLACGIIKKVDLYESFAQGIKQTISLLAGIFPYVATVMIMTEVAKACGAVKEITQVLSPLFKTLGIPSELSGLILLKPFSGSGSLAVLSELFAKYGADSYISRCAACIYGSSETTFYVSAVYYSACKNKTAGKALIVSLFSALLSAIFACIICKIM